MHYKSFAKILRATILGELFFVATSEPRMILLLFLKFGLNAAVLHFLKNSSSVIFLRVFKVYVICLYIFTVQDWLFLETPLSGCFRPGTIFFS